MATGAEGSAEREEVRLTVGVALVLEEGAVVEGGVALLADEAVRVPLLVEGGYVFLCDWGVATAAFGGKLVEIARLAVGGLSPLMEPLVS